MLLITFLSYWHGEYFITIARSELFHMAFSLTKILRCSERKAALLHFCFEVNSRSFVLVLRRIDLLLMFAYLRKTPASLLYLLELIDGSIITWHSIGKKEYTCPISINGNAWKASVSAVPSQLLRSLLQGEGCAVSTPLFVSPKSTAAQCRSSPGPQEPDLGEGKL